MRILGTLFFVSAISQAAGFNAPIDLSAPGVLESLQERRPDHYAKVRAILALVESRAQFNLGPWIEAEFDASDVDFLHLWRVSDPPKLKVSFTLDDARYTAVVVPMLQPARAAPAR